MYESPITVFEQTIRDELIKQTENEIVSEVTHQLGVYVDKERLLKALNYDSDQYNKGFADGRRVGYRQALEEMGMINDNDTSI